MQEKNLFKKEFEQRLLFLRIKTKFVKEIKKDLKNFKQEDQFNKRVEMANKKDLWASFIATAFIWDTTTDGLSYWKNIAMMKDNQFNFVKNIKVNGK